MERGDINNPTGNAIIYWRIKRNNKLSKKAEIIAANFVISPLPFNDETLMVNFPPVFIENYEKLLRIAEINNIDIIKGDDIDIPEDINDFNKFYKKQIEKYNGVIQKYLRSYKEKNSLDNDVRSLPQLINLAGEIMVSVRRLVKRRVKGNLIKNKIERLKRIQGFLNMEMKGFDLDNLIHIIDNPDGKVDRLVDLYKEKFLAIFLENYERADLLKKEILRIETSLSH